MVRLTKNTEHREVTLDPESWDEFRVLGHKILDDMITHIMDSKTKSSRPASKEEIRGLTKTLTKKGEGEQKVYESFIEDLLASSVGTKQARFWGFVAGGGSPYGMLADMIASGINWGDMPGFATSALNKIAVNYVKELLEYPPDASGIFLSGGSEANFTGLAVARNACAEIDMKTKGMQNVPKRMTIYMSDQGHDCLDRSVELLGFGNEALRRIPSDSNYKIKIDELKKTIKLDSSAGFHPICIIGCAGTVNTGAFDDLNALADLAEKEKMWLHVDGAFGAWVKLSKTHRHLADGMERADSLAVDLHKWMDMPYGIGCTLTRHPMEHVKTFVYGHEAEYLKSVTGNLTDQLLTYNLGIRLSNHTLAVKPYMLLRANGTEKYGKLVQQNIDHINYLAELIQNQPNMEVCAPVESNIVCFQYKPKNLSDEQIEKLNKAILASLWAITWGVVTDTRIKGKYVLRACNV
ncbi:MAG: pyridoxal-dependent decarboxylase, partial [Candidatus Bathyarchaeota archaeon]|nr:pyridoxal-dependent decarboxylase [Candidatus Bathyarchaeota archaeon]